MIESPDLTQPVIEFIDCTPDEDFPLRILKAYRENCNVRWATGTNGECNNPLFTLMNEHAEQRVKILDKAIKRLERRRNENI